MNTVTTLLVTALALTACGEGILSRTVADEIILADAATRDSGVSPGGSRRDASSSDGEVTPDTWPPDASTDPPTPDTRPTDASTPDTRPPDASTPDTRPPDMMSSCEDAIDADDRELHGLINDYRASLGLSRIPLSCALSTVARTHVQDSTENSPSAPASCNLHSWSDAGPWSACCYTSDGARASCMWDKPRELTDYTGTGFEISVGFGSSASAMLALELWQGSRGHNDVIINAGVWDEPWLAMGAAMNGSYAHVWFGRESDTTR